MRLRTFAALAVAGAVSLPAVAQVPAGGDFEVSSYTTFSQGQPVVAATAAGDFVVAWDSYGQDGSQRGIFAQRFQPSGARRGPEFRVSTTTTLDQQYPALAMDAAGNFVVAWRSESQDGNGWGIFAQRFQANGASRGAEFRVNTTTGGNQQYPAVASGPGGNFVVVWESGGQDGSGGGIYAQCYDAGGAPLGVEFRANSYTTGNQAWPAAAADPEGQFLLVWEDSSAPGGILARRYTGAGAPASHPFRVNTYTTGTKLRPAVAADGAGNFVVAWMDNQGGATSSILARRLDTAGALGPEFRVNSYTSSSQSLPALAFDAAGNFVAVWAGGHDGSFLGAFGQRFLASGAPRGLEFRVNAVAVGNQNEPVVASDAVGNFVVAFENDFDVNARRFGWLLPAALAADPAAGSVLEPNEIAAIKPSWTNLHGRDLAFAGAASNLSGPSGTGVAYFLRDGHGDYSTVANGATAQCVDCYELEIQLAGARPATHWDATLREVIAPDAQGQTKTWRLHVGQSFEDVPKTSAYYRFVETQLHHGVTGGCTAARYCPADAVTREQMSVFALVGKEGAGFVPPACATPVFSDVPASSPFCRWVEELERRGIVSGCGSGNYCPASPVTREQMAVFMLRTLDPGLEPPACATPVFSDVPASSPFCRWIEELERRAVVAGCGGGNYCPADSVTREQMGVFIVATFGLTLYGP